MIRLFINISLTSLQVLGISSSRSIIIRMIIISKIKTTITITIYLTGAKKLLMIARRKLHTLKITPMYLLRRINKTAFKDYRNSSVSSRRKFFDKPLPTISKVLIDHLRQTWLQDQPHLVLLTSIILIIT